MKQAVCLTLNQSLYIALTQGNVPFHLGFNLSGSLSAYDQKKTCFVVCCRSVQNLTV